MKLYIFVVGAAFVLALLVREVLEYRKSNT